MIIRIFTVFDEKANAYMSPFGFGHIGEAVRSFIDAARSPDHKFYKHGHDFTLYHHGHFDDGTGLFDLFAQPKMIGRADIMRKHHEDQVAKGFAGTSNPLLSEFDEENQPEKET